MWARLRSWLGGVVGRERVERDLSDEVRFHLRERAEHWRRQGLAPAEAARRARIEFGAVEAYKEDCRQALGLRWLDEVSGDPAYAVRRMRAAPAFSLVTISILAIAIGANTAVFSVVESVLLRMLPVARPHELRELAWIDRRDSSLKVTYNGPMFPYGEGQLRATSFAYSVYTHLRDRSTVFSDLFLFSRRRLIVGVAGHEHPVSGLLVSGNFLSALNVKMAIGRAIQPADDRVDAPLVVALTDGLWQRGFGGNCARRRA